MVNMMRSGIMRLQEGGSPWYINILSSGSKGAGETAAEKARREFLEKWFEDHSLAVPVGQENWDPFAGDTAKEYELWLVYDELFPGEAPEPGEDTPYTPPEEDFDEEDTPYTPPEEDFDEDETAPGEDETAPGEDETAPEEGEKKTVTNPDGTTTEYEFKDGKWVQIAAGLFGLGIGPWLKDFFGATGAGGDFLSGIFGQGGNIADLLKLFLQGKIYKEAWDAATYEVPTGQGAAMSEFEKANPFTGNMTLAGMAPNYLQGQDYGIPVGEQGIPAATHTIGNPYAEPLVEEVASGQKGGIMNTKGHGDVIPALLEPDEFVFTRKAVQNMGGGDARQGAKKMYSIMKNLEGMR
tara:strand:+ start:2009 stop:3064 length:1056 start_codon:yes stop_codon:yes gene_type:complete